jgi:hypothetical protein
MSNVSGSSEDKMATEVEMVYTTAIQQVDYCCHSLGQQLKEVRTK